MAETLLEEVNPNGNIQAVVEADDDVCYFYLFGASDTQFGIRAVWVRNHSQAPEAFEIERMQSGAPPRNPAFHCRHAGGQAALAAEGLRVVWLPEGNGAALYERDEILAIIPPWSGTNEFRGYARDNIGKGPVAWELSPNNVLFERFKQAESYWRKWNDEEFWPSIQSSQISQLEKVFGRHAKYYAIDGGRWPPKAMVRFAWRDRTVLVTVGVALRPQPNVEMTTEAPEQLRRMNWARYFLTVGRKRPFEALPATSVANPTCPGPNTRGSVRDILCRVTNGRIRITQRLSSSMSIPVPPKLPWKRFWAIRSMCCGSFPSLKTRDRLPSTKVANG